MKFLKNEFEFRQWIAKNYFPADEGYPSVLSPDELEIEILKNMPKNFPCLARVVNGINPNEQEVIEYFYRSDVEEFAKSFGIYQP